MGAGRGQVGKAGAVSVQGRNGYQVFARVSGDVAKPTLQGFFAEHTDSGGTVYTDDTAINSGLLYRNETFDHSVNEFGRGQAHVNGVESYRALLKHGRYGTFHHTSAQRLLWNLSEFSGCLNDCGADTVGEVRNTIAGIVGKRFMCSEFVGEKTQWMP